MLAKHLGVLCICTRLQAADKHIAARAVNPSDPEDEWRGTSLVKLAARIVVRNLLYRS
jgi:hypothetical protein